MPVQMRFAARLTSENYVSERGWLLANLDRCPVHPDGGCSFRRHTPYERKWPIGAKIPRWSCPEARATFSLLPDFLASHLPGPLVEIEAVALAVETGPSIEAVASELRPDIELPGAVRWVRRRFRWFREAVSVARGLLEVLAGVVAGVSVLLEDVDDAQDLGLDAPLDAVCIAAGLVGRLPEPSARDAIARIVARAETLGLRVVADGVNDASVEREVLRAGVPHLRGARYGAPASACRVAEWLWARR